MKKFILPLLAFYFINQSEIFAKNDIDPVKYYKVDDNYNWVLDNPKGKIKIRFVKNEDKSDTTNKPKSFFGKLKNVINMILDASDNPPFKVEIVREKEKKN